MKGQLEAAGFTNVQVQDYKVPIGTWPKHPIYKDAGRVKAAEMKSGMEGWIMYLLTRFGQPVPWSLEEAQVLLAKMRTEIDAGYHIYQKARR